MSAVGRLQPLTAKHRSVQQAALAAFVARGYAATALEDIAAAAAVSRQTLYNRYGGKERLFLEVTDQAICAQLDEITAATQSYPDPPIDVRGYLRCLGERIARVYLNPQADPLRTLIQSELPRHQGLRELWEARSTTPVWSTLIGNLARLAHAGHLQVDDPVLAAGQFVTLVTGSAWQMTPMGTFAIPGRNHDDWRSNLAANVDLFLTAYRHHPEEL